MKASKSEKIGVSIRPETKAIIDIVNARLSLFNFSAALRHIVHDWARANGIDPDELLAHSLPQPEAQK